MARDPEARSLTTSIGDVETIRVPTHTGEYEPIGWMLSRTAPAPLEGAVG